MPRGKPQTRETILAETRILPNGCVEWTGGRFKSGYGRVGVDHKSRRAHRVFYEMFNGPIPDGLVIDHLCRNKLCVAPAHLEAVTDRMNILRGEGPAAQNSRKAKCKNGHDLTPENTYAFVSSWAPNGGRKCRKCALAAHVRYYERKASA